MKNCTVLIIISLLTFSCESGSDNDETNPINETTVNSGNIYFENNTCKCPDAVVGDQDLINGITYIAVNNSTITGEISNGNFKLCTTLVTDMSGSTAPFRNFFNDNSFNSDISFWDVSNVVNMDGMFFEATTFNQNIGNWDVSSVSNMGSMFKGASSFNRNIGNWDTANVTKMLGFFEGATVFNQDIGNWDTSKVISMQEMFKDALAFDQNLSGWCVTNIATQPNDFLTNSPLSITNQPVWGTCPD